MYEVMRVAKHGGPGRGGCGNMVSNPIVNVILLLFKTQKIGLIWHHKYSADSL